MSHPNPERDERVRVGWEKRLSNRRTNRRRFGFCVDCGEPSDGFERCLEHREKAAQASRRYRSTHPEAVQRATRQVATLKSSRIVNGLCKDCAAPITKFTLCARCRRKASQRSARWRERKLNEASSS